MDTMEFLKKTDIFKGLNEKQLASVGKGFREVEFRKGQRIFKEGEEIGRASCRERV